MAEQPILYDLLLSGNCYKIRLFASLISLPIALHEVDVLGGAHRADWFGQLNPLRQIPVLRDVDGTVVQDSQAILTYLALKHAPDWTATTPAGLAAVTEWLSYAAKEVSNGPQLARLHFLDPHEDIDIARAQTAGRKVLAHLDAVLGGRDWLCLGRPTIADIAVFPYVGLARQGRLPLDDHANVVAWIDRIAALPGYISMPGLTKEEFR